MNLRWVVTVPVIVEGTVWGCTVVSRVSGASFPPETEQRIGGFTALVATAIANAQARAQLRRLADEQRALRRVATLAAQGATLGAIVDAATDEASRLVDADLVVVVRNHPGGDGTVLASSDPLLLAPGDAAPRERDGIIAAIQRSGGAERLSPYDLSIADIRPHDGAPHSAAAAGAPIEIDGLLWGTIIGIVWNRPLATGVEGRLGEFAEIVATAIVGVETRDALAASRARVVEAADETRRRIQRDLHDGAQQRLVHAIRTLRMAQDVLGDVVGDVPELIEEAVRNAERAHDDMRDLVRGIMPAALTHGGLAAAVSSFVGQLDLDVTVAIAAARYPDVVERTAYFVIAEALTNTVKHADASQAGVVVDERRGALHIRIADDGRGDADPRTGSGLVGLTDRVEAGRGTIAIVSPRGEGTTIEVALPLRQDHTDA